MFDCTCNTQNSLLLNQHNGDDAPQDTTVSAGQANSHILRNLIFHLCFNNSPHLEPILSHICGPARAMVPRSHTATHHSLWDSSGWVIIPKYIPVPDTTHKRQTFMPLMRFEPVIPARSRDHRDRNFSSILYNITFASINKSPTWGSYFEVSRTIFVHFLTLSWEIYAPLIWTSFILSL